MPFLDLDPQIDVPIYDFLFSMGFSTMIGDIKDYLDISERNIESMYRAELQSIKHREDSEDLPPGYITSLESNAEHRFS